MKSKTLRCGVLLIICSLLLLSSASASYIVSAGSKTGATSTFAPTADYDIYGNIEYNYFGEDTDTSYDYVIDLVAMSSYVTNRGIALAGTWYYAGCNSNGGNTLGSMNYVATPIPSNASWQHTSVNWSAFALANGRDTMFRFNEDEFVLFNIGTYVDYYGLTNVSLGALETIWTSSGRTSSWEAY